MSKNIEKLQLIEESLNQLVKECKEEQFLYGYDSIEARKAKRLEKKLDSLETEVFFIKTDIAKEKPKVDKEIADYLIKSGELKSDYIEILTEENELLRTENEQLKDHTFGGLPCRGDDCSGRPIVEKQHKYELGFKKIIEDVNEQIEKLKDSHESNFGNSYKTSLESELQLQKFKLQVLELHDCYVKLMGNDK